ncbi:MAG: S9 family peptidase [Bacteroidales bacterium]|nr:MAG: S9 family peptidase [Bacteroidales bacterium]
MKKLIPIFLSAILLISVSCYRNGAKYPKSKKVDVVDTYFGVKVHDPYRWLEDNSSNEVAEWVQEQNEVTNKYLSGIPFRDKIKERLTELWNYSTMSTPFKEGGKYFFYKKEPDQNQSILYIQETLESEPRLILDPNKLSTDGTVAVSDVSVSKDGKYLAYAIADGGSDWRKIKVMDIATGSDLIDEINWVKFSDISWFKNGFFYSRFDAPKDGKGLVDISQYQKVYYHKLGDAQEQDEIILGNSTVPSLIFTSQVTSNEKYLIIYEAESTYGNSIYIKNLTCNDGIVKLTTGYEFEYRVLDDINDNIIVLTNYKAPKYKLIKINVNTLDVGNWRDILPEKKEVLESCYLIGGKVVANYIQDAKSKVEVYDLNGEKINQIDFPTLGRFNGINGNIDDSVAFYSFSSFTIPTIVYKYNVITNKSSEFFKPAINFNFDDYETKQVFYTSKDGTSVPMFIVCKKGIALDGKNPTLLYGYGGFNVSLLPYFSIDRLLWLENGGIYAQANIRGGGEYGENWYKSGTKLNKQNVFDDFIAAAEYLIKEKYTTPRKLAIEGASNGGLLIGAVVNQRPELFKVAIPEVGVMDMVRFDKFTIGSLWINDFGSSADSLQFINLYKYSPLHNVRSGVRYPAIMVTTADRDDRVVPAHSYKYIAAVQDKQRHSRNPSLIRIQTRAGHGAGTPTSILIGEATDIYSFTFYNLGEELK